MHSHTGPVYTIIANVCHVQVLTEIILIERAEETIHREWQMVGQNEDSLPLHMQG